MSDELNPYASPAIVTEHQDAEEIAALRRLRGPSLGLLLLGGLVASAGVVFLPLLLIGAVVRLFFPTFPGGRPEDLLAIPTFLASYPTVIGAWKMRRGTSYRWAYTAAVLACIPMPSPFIIFNIPLGIWALVVLHRRDVKEVFSSKARRSKAATASAD